jgi:hypothetical protein
VNRWLEKTTVFACIPQKKISVFFTPIYTHFRGGGRSITGSSQFHSFKIIISMRFSENLSYTVISNLVSNMLLRMAYLYLVKGQATETFISVNTGYGFHNLQFLVRPWSCQPRLSINGIFQKCSSLRLAKDCYNTVSDSI